MPPSISTMRRRGPTAKSNSASSHTSDRPNATVTLKLKDQTLLTETIRHQPRQALHQRNPPPHGRQRTRPPRLPLRRQQRTRRLLPSKTHPRSPTHARRRQLRRPQIHQNQRRTFPHRPCRIEQIQHPLQPRQPRHHHQRRHCPKPTGTKPSLARDPGDIRHVNTAMGIRVHRKGQSTPMPKKFLRTALARAHRPPHHTQSWQEPRYYLGLALEARSGKLFDDAFTPILPRHLIPRMGATRVLRNGPNHLHQSRDFAHAPQLRQRQSILASNTTSIRAWPYPAAMLRHTGNNAEALKTLEALRAIDPLDVRALAEQWLTTKSPESMHALAKQVNILPTTALRSRRRFPQRWPLVAFGSDFIGRAIATIPDPSKGLPSGILLLRLFLPVSGQSSS